MQYKYRAVVTDVYDGDTITCDIDIGFGIWLRKQKIRLYGINAPEVRGESKELGLIARDYLRKRILDKDVELQTFKDKKGKYGRWLAIVYLEEEDMNACLVNRELSLANYYK